MLAAPSRDKKTIRTSPSEPLWVPILWDKGLTPPPQLAPLVCSKQPLRSRLSWRLLLPLCSHTSLFMFSDPALAFTPASPSARRHPQHNTIGPTLPTALPTPLSYMPPPSDFSLDLPLGSSSPSPSRGAAALLRWTRFLESQYEGGTSRLHS